MCVTEEINESEQRGHGVRNGRSAFGLTQGSQPVGGVTVGSSSHLNHGQLTGSRLSEEQRAGRCQIFAHISLTEANGAGG